MRLATNFLFHLILFSVLSPKASSRSGITCVFSCLMVPHKIKQNLGHCFLLLKSFLISCLVISTQYVFPG